MASISCPRLWYCLFTVQKSNKLSEGKILWVLRCCFACLIWDFRKFHLWCWNLCYFHLAWKRINLVNICSHLFIPTLMKIWVCNLRSNIFYTKKFSTFKYYIPDLEVLQLKTKLNFIIKPSEKVERVGLVWITSVFIGHTSFPCFKISHITLWTFTL